ncbi:hypothetical protein TIFTF001_013482 [Ficus carica]|uniref:Uncharacterized protein n=1 Tax=Ficus carica TaxID=3494 RepID=A0AA88A215_FICCA|nr:hypothetical protein TIFTF001_013482 [Ficus carica]
MFSMTRMPSAGVSFRIQHHRRGSGDGGPDGCTRAPVLNPPLNPLPNPTTNHHFLSNLGNLPGDHNLAQQHPPQGLQDPPGGSNLSFPIPLLRDDHFDGFTVTWWFTINTAASGTGRSSLSYYYSDEDEDDGAPRAREKPPPE